MRKIAIVRRNGLGDLLAAFPLVLYYQRTCPEARITLFVGERNAVVLPYLPPVANVVVIPTTANKYLTLLQVALAHRDQHYDVAVATSTSPRWLLNAFIFALGATRRIAYVDQTWHRHLINEPRLLDRTLVRHQALKILRLADERATEVPRALYPRIRLESVMPRPFEGPTLLLAASTTRAPNRLAANRYAQIVNALYETHEFAVVITGLEGDRARAEAIASLLHSPSIVIIPSGFDEVMRLLDCCDLFFVGDGGVAHLGAALGKEEVVVFGATLPTEWAPLNPNACVFYHPEHVDHIDADELGQALKTLLERVINNDGRGLRTVSRMPQRDESPVARTTRGAE